MAELAQERKVASEMWGTATKAAIAVIGVACFLGTAEATVAIAKAAAGGACALSTALKKTARAALEDAVSARDSMMAANAEVLATRRAIDALQSGEGRSQECDVRRRRAAEEVKSKLRQHIGDKDEEGTTEANLALQEATALARDCMHLAGKIDGLIETMVTYKAGARAEGRGCVTETGKAGNSVDKQDTSVRSCFEAEADGWDLDALITEAKKQTASGGAGSVTLKDAATVKAENNNCPFFSTANGGTNAMFSQTNQGGTWGGIWEVESHGTDIKLEQKQTNGEKPNSAAEEKQLAQLISRATELKRRVTNATGALNKGSVRRAAETLTQAAQTPFLLDSEPHEGPRNATAWLATLLARRCDHAATSKGTEKAQDQRNSNSPTSDRVGNARDSREGNSEDATEEHKNSAITETRETQSTAHTSRRGLALACLANAWAMSTPARTRTPQGTQQH
ncbi:hypothetical protein, conserved in T. vivax [Trypanosoma vivax Y486]|uniref:Uncharacterized protein n=1 Tax=Trypanosoma vivax (strain Y486) TaxID=1055687 RepID=F9WSI8_TRYVY|nr:hypothetical protein, conserved in T. vivax [Trypanosoma vivax Y486]|eukprot:CCD20527.1 hypothetical protein, conserved in T. vivax [Trypanosoma vivax Y486]